MSAESIDEKTVFNIARRIDSHEARADYLQQVCGANPAMLARVVALLEVQEQEQSFLESPAVTIDPTMDQPITERPGTVIGPYKLLEKIGEGGMGVVYLAEQQEPVARRVALKIIKPGMDTQQVIARFEAERQALAPDGPPQHRQGVRCGHDRQWPAVLRDGIGERHSRHAVL